MNPIISVENVSFHYSATEPLFENIQFSITSGKLTALIGPNGSGKSTLLRLLSGVIPPQQGDILLNKISIHRFPIRERAKKIAFLPQNISPMFPLTVFEIVSMGRFPRKPLLSGLSKTDYEIVGKCMDIMNLTGLQNRLYSELSGGECKRTLIASILAQEPEILLLDEPLSGLDLPHQIETLQHLQNLSNHGYTVVIASHEINTVARFAQEFILLSSNHQIIAQGSAIDTLTTCNLNMAYNASFWVGKHPFTNGILIEVAQKENL